MVVFGVFSLQVFVPRQFARVCQSVNMEWGVKENHADVISLHKGGKCYSQIFGILIRLKISPTFIYGGIKHYQEFWKVEDRAQY
jgi:hypothetical protein